MDPARHARHLMLPEIGCAGQERLGEARVLIVGCGGLGSPAALYLAAAGVGTLGLMDADQVDISNLQRQILHGTPDLGRPKVDSAVDRLQALDPDLRLVPMATRLDADNASRILVGWDMILDCTDNAASKFLIARVCATAHLPYVHAGINGFQGQLLTVVPGETACPACLFEDPPPAPPGPPAGPLGVLPGVIGTLQATEAIKHVLDLGAALTDRLLTFDALALRFREIPVARNPHCPICGRRTARHA